MHRLARFWRTLQDRPLAMAGVVAGMSVFVFIAFEALEIREKVIRVEQESPCTNLTTRECARKLLSSLTPEERREIERRFQADVERRARALARQQVGRGGDGAGGETSAPDVPGDTSPGGGGDGFGPTPGSPPSPSDPPDTGPPGGDGDGGGDPGVPPVVPPDVKPPPPVGEPDDEPTVETPPIPLPGGGSIDLPDLCLELDLFCERAQ